MLRQDEGSWKQSVGGEAPGRLQQIWGGSGERYAGRSEMKGLDEERAFRDF